MGAKIEYHLYDGSTIELEVSEEFAVEYHKMLKNERRLERKETRRHLSLEMLMEQEEQQNTQGYWENRSLKRNDERFSLISNELDPFEDLLKRERFEATPIVKALSLGLTDYQRKVAVEHYINNKTQTQIAAEFGVSHQAISNIIKKVQKKVLDIFT